jgi:hypothetical protein
MSLEEVQPMTFTPAQLQERALHRRDTPAILTQLREDRPECGFADRGQLGGGNGP